MCKPEDMHVMLALKEFGTAMEWSTLVSTLVRLKPRNGLKLMPESKNVPDFSEQ